MHFIVLNIIDITLWCYRVNMVRINFTIFTI